MKYDNSGTLSKNQRKEKDSHPDVTGQATIDGVAYWISGWKKEGERGPWYSLAFKVKEEQAAPKQASVGADDDIPF